MKRSVTRHSSVRIIFLAAGMVGYADDPPTLQLLISFLCQGNELSKVSPELPSDIRIDTGHEKRDKQHILSTI